MHVGMSKIVDGAREQREALSSVPDPEVNRAQRCLPGTGDRLRNKNAKNVPVLASAVREKDLISPRNY